ncbi:MAG: sodium:calcium antiporter [Chloroflexi bacterium]|nr:sodium:calcium antiporter [Chloroflexota bacterium]
MKHSVDAPPATRSFTRHWSAILVMVLLGLPGVVMRLAGYQPNPIFDAAVFGIAILSAAFLLSWAAETAEMDISQGLALAVIAFIAVLPEYAVDFVLAWKAGADPSEAERGLAIANMTGGNRLLIGVGWPVVFALFVYRSRLRELVVDRQRALELVFLTIATAYVLLIPLRQSITLLDSLILVSMFLSYLFFTSRQESEEVVLVGPALAMGALPTRRRRWLITLILVFSAGVIFAAAEPFAEALVAIGERFGVSEFLLIQWLAPLASESPEVLVAGLLAWRGRAAVGMGALISSKVNQWTLLIGTLPIAYSLSAGHFAFTGGLPLDDRQREEIFLTAAQSAFAIAVFANLRMSKREAILLFVLFASQLFITNEQVRIYYAIAYSLLCVVLLITGRRELSPTLRAAWDIVRGRPDPARERPDPARERIEPG